LTFVQEKLSVKRYIVIGILLLTALLTISAAANGLGGVSVIVDSWRWYYDGIESPLARLHDATIFPCDNSKSVYYYSYPHGDNIWINMGFDIARVEYSWHYGTGGGPDFSGTAYGSCGGVVIIPNVLLYTSEAGFFINQGGGLVNTCTIVSDLPASVDRITALCGSTPEDIRLKCAGPVKKLNLADMSGYWQCDPDLQMLGEARLPLFDPEGGTGPSTLYHVYQRHLRHTE
jgi:hypothetical protein